MNREVNPQLTEHQTSVLRLVAEGLTNGQIACDLGIKERTVEYHVSMIFQRLEVSSRVAAVVKAQRIGLLDT